jgi:tetratricopeptide (TPR) repeat protein
MVMMIEAKHRLARGPKQNGETRNGFRLFQTDPGSVVVTAYNAVEIMIALYQAKDYNGVLDALEKGPEAHEFSAFLGILATFHLSQASDIASDVRREYTELLREAIQRYRIYHSRQNGPKSIQCAYAALLACFCLPAIGQDRKTFLGCAYALKYLPDSEKLFSLIRGNRYFDAGNYDEALSFYRTLPLCYYDQVLRRLVSKELWHHAFGFSFLLCNNNNNPCNANATQFAQCCYALGMKPYAICSIGYENRAIMKTWPKSEWRVCEECWQPGHAKDMVRCTCKKTWYCNVACRIAFSRWHPCRTCAFCLVYIRAKHPWRCPQCYLRIYCSAECQSRDWYEKDHRDGCK